MEVAWKMPPHLSLKCGEECISKRTLKRQLMLALFLGGKYGWCALQLPHDLPSTLHTHVYVRRHAVNITHLPEFHNTLTTAGWYSLWQVYHARLGRLTRFAILDL